MAMRVIPGDVASVILSEGGENQDLVSDEQAELLREKLGLADPLPLQYGKWLWSMVNGTFGGESLITGEPISDMVVRRVLVTVQLALYTIVLSMAVSVPLGRFGRRQARQVAGLRHPPSSPYPGTRCRTSGWRS